MKYKKLLNEYWQIGRRNDFSLDFHSSDIGITANRPFFLPFYHCDHLMTPLQMTDKFSSTIWQADYYPFGKIYNQSGDIENNLRFPGQYADYSLSNSSIYYNWHRYYSSKIGRYLSK